MTPARERLRLNKLAIIERALAERMKAMVGFRNIAVHDDQQLQIAVLRRIVEGRLEDLKRAGEVLVHAACRAGP